VTLHLWGGGNTVPFTGVLTWSDHCSTA